MVKSILGLIYTILVILAVLDCVKSSKSSNQKIIWILVVLFITVAGLIAYHVVGKK